MALHRPREGAGRGGVEEHAAVAGVGDREPAAGQPRAAHLAPAPRQSARLCEPTAVGAAIPRARTGRERPPRDQDRQLLLRPRARPAAGSAAVGARTRRAPPSHHSLITLSSRSYHPLITLLMWSPVRCD